MKVYVRVRLADTDRTLEWREVDAETLDAAIKVAEQMEDVEVCLDASITSPVGGWHCVGKNPKQIKQIEMTGSLLMMGGLGQQGDVT